MGGCPILGQGEGELGVPARLGRASKTFASLAVRFEKAFLESDAVSEAHLCANINAVEELRWVSGPSPGRDGRGQQGAHERWSRSAGGAAPRGAHFCTGVLGLLAGGPQREYAPHIEGPVCHAPGHPLPELPDSTVCSQGDTSPQGGAAAHRGWESAR